jgi:hypothetical protein
MRLPEDFVDSGGVTETAMAQDLVFSNQHPDVLWTDNMLKGYARIEFRRESSSADFAGVETVRSSDDRAFIVE